VTPSVPSEAIALFLPSLAGGGAERVLLTLGATFAAEGHPVDLVLATAEGPYLDQVPAGVRLVDLDSRRVLTSLPRLVAYLRRARPRAMISAITHTNIVALWGKRLARVATRMIVTEHGVAPRPPGRSGRAYGLFPILMHGFYPGADSVVAVSHGLADDLAERSGLPRARIDVVYNPVVTPELAVRAAAPVDHPWLAPRQPPVVLSVGRLTAQKDYPTLIRAFERIAARSAARLVILGEGEAHAELESLVQATGLAGRVALPGFVANPYAYMARAKVFVLSSIWEGLPTVLVEALACGCPVISTDCRSGPREILEDGAWGRLVPVGAVDELATAMLAVLRSTEEPVGSIATARFTPAASVAQYLRLIEEPSLG
jgi:glycosyltransferase involved in cell wall biosynthesis